MLFPLRPLTIDRAFEHMFDCVDQWMSGEVDSHTAMSELSSWVTALEAAWNGHKAAVHGGAGSHDGRPAAEEEGLGADDVLG